MLPITRFVPTSLALMTRSTCWQLSWPLILTHYFTFNPNTKDYSYPSQLLALRVYEGYGGKYRQQNLEGAEHDCDYVQEDFQLEPESTTIITQQTLSFRS